MSEQDHSNTLSFYNINKDTFFNRHTHQLKREKSKERYPKVKSTDPAYLAVLVPTIISEPGFNELKEQTN